MREENELDLFTQISGDLKTYKINFFMKAKLL